MSSAIKIKSAVSEREQWREKIGPLIIRALSQEAFAYQGVRKILQDITYEVPGNDAFPILAGGYSDIGYSKNKHSQMLRNYYNADEFARIRTILEKRQKQSFTSVSLSLRGKPKDTRSQGWCMNSLVLSRARDGRESIELQYRSTELILKFGGDLVFIPWILKELGLDPSAKRITRFRFANAYLSAVFFPTAGALWGDAVEFLETVWKYDQELFRHGTRFFLRSAYREDQVFPYSPENQQHKFSWKTHRADMPRIRKYLEQKHKTFGKILPTTHYAKGEYVPRGKR